MKFRPELPMHDRYEVDHDFLTADVGDEVVTISRLVNAFFRWEFNSCEILVARRRGAPDRLRQRLPGRRADLAALLLPVGDDGAGALDRVLRWSTGRKPRLDLDMAGYFAIADRDDLSYGDKLAALPPARRRLLRDRALPRLLREPAAPPRRGRARVGRQRRTSTRCCVDTVRATYPAHEHDRFVAHFRGLVGLWVTRREGGPAAHGRSARVEVQVGGEPLGHLDHPLQVVVPDDDQAVADHRRPPVAARRAHREQVDEHDVAAVRGQQRVEALDVGDPAVALGPLEDAAGVVLLRRAVAASRPCSTASAQPAYRSASVA